ncbi:EpsG family protein [Ruminococcus sp. YE71]|uniref:EpsG family protein n=1 Tax=unclassified Ruminococcus TaxID=2608920 RepID=UPI000885AC22|nr:MULTISPECIES: EpsG family protein [unclassified Ruminococcus]SDA11372.1 EpsG family protein [Ruminococcus sp. YE78]SFW15156.1 EpsG family protein [Ruminococcus sp. YE71]
MMFPYVYLIGLIELTRFLKPNTKFKRLFVSIFCGILISLIIGLRHPSMGNDLRWYDSYGYLGGFQRIGTLPWGITSYQNYEIGYIFFNKVLSCFTRDNQIFLIVCAVCSIAPFTYVIYRYSTDIQTSYIILFGTPVFTMMFSGLRQSLAIGIVILSLPFIKEKKIIPFILTIFIATLFHDTAIIFSLAYPLYNYGKLLDKKTLIFLITIVFALRKPLLSSVGSLISHKNTIDNNGSINMFIACFALLVFFLLATKDNDVEINGLMKIYYISCICMVFSGINSLAMRAAFYFIVILIVLVPCLYDESKSDSIIIKIEPRNGFIVIINIVFIALGLFFVFTTDWAHAYPYRFYWE